MILAYLGPETLLPLTSILAAVAGGVLMFGRNLTRLVVGGLRMIARKAKGESTPAGRKSALLRRAGRPDGARRRDRAASARRED